MSQKKIPSYVLVLILLISVIGLDLNRRYLSGEFDTDKIELTVLYSSEKRGFLESVVGQFETQWRSDHDGKEINVVMNPIGTGKGTIQLANGAAKPAVWSPASRFWLPILNLLWSAGHETNLVSTEAPSLVVSPTVIATWKSYQEEKNITGLEDIRQLALNDPNFTYAHTDPFESNSGFGGVIMQTAVAAGKNPEDLLLEDLSDPDVQQWMRDIESAAIQYGSSTGFLGKLMADEGPNHLKAALIYENLVLEKNKDLEGDKLVAIYPVEGTLLNDHPYAILNAPWVSDQDKVLAQEFLDFLILPEIQAEAIEFGFRPVIETAELLDLINQKFVEEEGVKSSLTGLHVYSIGNIPGEVLERIPDLWSATRSRSLGSDNSGEPTLTFTDYIIPAILLGLIVLMILTPIVSSIRRRFR